MSDVYIEVDGVQKVVPLAEVVAHKACVLNFIGKIQQAEAIYTMCAKPYFSWIEKIYAMVQATPVTHEQDGLGDSAIAHLHYFLGDNHWYITEKDIEGDGEQYQAYGYACLAAFAGCEEYGYISIVELLENDVFLDLDFKPTAMEIIKQQRKAD